MNETVKKVGVVVGVDGDLIQVGVYNMSNDVEFIWHGDVLEGARVGGFLTINQNEIKLICKVLSEKVMDQQNSVKSIEFDNRYRKNSINRIITLKLQGVIEHSCFKITSKYVPMVGNEVTLTTKDEMNIIYEQGKEGESIKIGQSVLSSTLVSIPIDKFFASHIGIFGNTGSGKSNTLHKLYLELFRTEYYEYILSKSKFFLIDFNGEYINKDLFEIESDHKSIFQPNTRNNNGDKLPIKKDYIFDSDILSILFEASPGTQVPFLRGAMKVFNEEIKDGESFSKIEMGLLSRILIGYKGVSVDALDNWILAAENIGVDSEILNELVNILVQLDYGNVIIRDINGTIIMKEGQITKEGKELIKYTRIQNALKDIFDKATPIMKLSHFLQFQRVYVTAWKSTNIEHINPLFKRIESAFFYLEKVIEIKEEIDMDYKMFNIINLVDTNHEISRLLPMLISKMIYEMQKENNSKGGISNTCHLIIDEAHNILCSDHKNIKDDWQDYRLSIFEEIIKEGRKFGFYLTLASQRPADISPTILSQAHNYFIHRLVNERDLRMLENTMPTLDRFSYMTIPKLGQGECIITGTATKIPVFAKIDKEITLRPDSDDVILTHLWN